MKKLIFLLLLVASFSECKKKNKSDSNTTPAAVQPQISVKINGVTFSCSVCYSSYYSGGMRGVTFWPSAMNDQILFGFSSTPGTGTFSLVKQGNPYMTYVKNNVYHHAVSGNLVITSLDTSSLGTIKTFIGSFECTTDTSGGLTPYTFSEGKFNVNNK